MMGFMCRGYRVDPDMGVVYGIHGTPIRRVDTGGYIQVNRHGKNIGSAHRMIWEAVNGPVPDGLEINHINGIKTDNRIVNLEVVTSRENTLHAYRTGLTSAVGDRNGRAKLTPAIVRDIRRDKRSSNAKLAIRYGVCRSTIRDTRSGRCWSFVS